MIKPPQLKKDIPVDGSTILELTGINSLPVFTIGSVVLGIQLRANITTALFQVMYDNFLISETGVLGAPFLRDNGAFLDFKTSTLSIVFSEPSEPPEPQKVPIALIIQSRTETLVPVQTDEEDGTTLLIHTQNIGMEGILVGNTNGSSEA